MVEVHTEQSGMVYQGFVIASSEDAGKGAVIEVCGFELSGLFWVGNFSQVVGALFEVVAGDDVVDLQ